jgi:hypothetical protein
MLVQSLGEGLQSAFDDLFWGTKLPLGQLLLQELFTMRSQSDIQFVPSFSIINPQRQAVLDAPGFGRYRAGCRVSVSNGVHHSHIAAPTTRLGLSQVFSLCILNRKCSNKARVPSRLIAGPLFAATLLQNLGNGRLEIGRNCRQLREGPSSERSNGLELWQKSRSVAPLGRERC